MTEHVNAVIHHDQISQSPSYGGVIALNDGRLMWGWGSGHADPVRPLMANFSEDGGATWTDPVELKQFDGEPVMGIMDINLLRLPSGALGLAQRSLYRAEQPGQPQRAGLSFHRSGDEGETWSQAIPINPPETDAVFTNDKSIVLKDGRVVVPFYASIGPTTAPVSKYRSQFGEEMSTAELGSLSYSSAYYSDDDGATWTRSFNETYVMLDHGIGGKYIMGEPELVELNDGRILMLGRTNLGVFFRCYSEDRAETWTEPVPTGLACPPTPCSVVQLPGTGDLLVVFNQVSRWEAMIGIYRHRLSTAVSKDNGETWEQHKNLESLDDVTYVKPDGLKPFFQGRFKQPIDRTRYHRAPGPLRFSYPSCTVVDDRVIITYGMSVFGDKSVIADTYGVDYDQLMEEMGLAPYDSGNKIRVMSPEWFYH